MRYDLVIFDNDGVLVDSEPVSNRLLAAYLTELGHPTSYEDSLRDYMGAAMHRVHDLVEERSGRRLPANFDDVFHGRVFAAFERELSPVAGAVGVLEKLTANGVSYCVASSGSHERIRVGHRKTGLDRWFDDSRIFLVDVESLAGQQDQLLRGICSIEIQLRIAFGVAVLLRGKDCFWEVEAVR